MTLRLRLSLKLLADVGIIGFPNAGKSTLLSRISAARPKIANYPFTTLVPSLGVVEVDDRRFVAADVPGLIEGASEGAGLGDRFLRHIERTRVLVHLLDVAAMLAEGRDLLSDYDAIRQELGRYRPELLERSELVAINKTELLTNAADAQRIADLEKTLRDRGCEVLRISNATGEGVSELVVAMLRCIDEVGEAAEADVGSSA
jgi:GTP-binding protein